MPIDPSLLGSATDAVVSVALTVLGVVFAVAAVGLYVLPSTIAIARKHHNTATIVALNLLLGWMFIGWVVSLALSLSETRPHPAAYPPLQTDPHTGATSDHV